MRRAGQADEAAPLLQAAVRLGLGDAQLIRLLAAEYQGLPGGRGARVAANLLQVCVGVGVFLFFWGGVFISGSRCRPCLQSGQRRVVLSHGITPI
jgi:hypothetical protein